MKKDYSKLLWGLVIVAIGVIFSGNVLNWWDINIFFPGWWTLFLIVPGIISLCKDGFSWGASIIVIIGGILLIDRLDIFNVRILWKLVIPVLIILLGISVILSFFREGKNEEKEHIDIDFTDVKDEFKKSSDYSEYATEQFPSYSVIFASKSIKITSTDLKGVKLESVFAGVVLDLRDAKFTSDIILDISNVFAGVDIYVPEDVNVETISGTPILGGISNRENKNLPGALKIKIKYTSIFGGIEIK